MKTNNLINKSKFLFKSTLVALALLFVNAVTANAQTVYVQLGFGPDYSYWTSSFNGYHTYVLYWQDAEATIPAADPYLDINVAYVSRTNCGYKYDQNFTGNTSQIEGNYFGQPYWAEDYDYVTHETTTTTTWYELRPGTGYQIANEPYIMGGPADYCP